MEKISNKGMTGKHVQMGTPTGYTSITPFIVVNNPSEAIEFYKSVFSVKVKDVTEFPDENGNIIIAHAVLDFGNGHLQLGAANPAYHLVPPPGEDNVCYSLGIYVEDADRAFEKAVEKGAIVREPISYFVSGDRYGSILDPYGVRWSIMSRVEDLSEEESIRRVAEWAKSFSGNE